MKKIYILIVASLISSFGIACSCAGYLTFCENIDINTTVSMVEIKRIIVEPNFETYWDIEILEDLHLENTKSQYRILAGPGTSCDPFLFFNIGDTLIIRHFNNNLSSTLPHDFFFVNGCVQNFIKVENGVVNLGRFLSEVVPLSQFLAEFQTCLDVSPLDDPETLDRQTDLFPNPAYDAINLRVRDASFFEYEIFDAFGKKVISDSQLGTRAQIPLQHLPHGVYFVSIRFRETTTVRKFVKS